MVRRADDFGNDSSIDVVNPDDDTSTEALAAWIAELEGADDWIELPMTAAVLIDEDRLPGRSRVSCRFSPTRVANHCDDGAVGVLR